jgi:hypothetical protein
MSTWDGCCGVLPQYSSCPPDYPGTEPGAWKMMASEVAARLPQLAAPD